MHAHLIYAYILGHYSSEQPPYDPICTLTFARDIVRLSDGTLDEYLLKKDIQERILFATIYDLSILPEV